MNHTLEPWHVGKEGVNNDELPVVTADGATIAGCWPIHDDVSWPGAIDFGECQKANARRIVACVNACVGIPTEQLENLTLLSALNTVENLLGDYARGALRGSGGGMSWEDLDATAGVARSMFPGWYEKILAELAPEYFPREDWECDVANGDTKLGYDEWLAHNIESSCT